MRTVHVRTRQRRKQATRETPERVTIRSSFTYDGEPFSIVAETNSNPGIVEHSRAALDAVEAVTKSIGSFDGGRVLIGGYAFPIIINK